jgi:hypothetical protein
LEEPYRQINDPLLNVLNDIRSGTAGEHTRVPLRTRYKKEPQGATKATKLYARNINVDSINQAELAKLAGEEKTFVMQTRGFNALVEGLKKSCLASEILKLKVGAEVMFIKNDVNWRYVNGTRCVVVGFGSGEGGWPIVKTFDDRIITAQPEEWLYQENGTTRAALVQIPLRLAWAITIHKSQGMTLDAAEMDLGDAFEPGMGYVALSRVRSLNGLKLMNLNAMALTIHSKVLEYDKFFQNNSAEAKKSFNHLSDAQKADAQIKTLLERFEGNPDKPQKETRSRIKIKKEAIPTHEITFQLLKEGLSLDEMAEKRALTLGTILTHLEKLKGQQKIDDDDLMPLRKNISSEDFEIIFEALKKSEDGKLTPIFEQLDGKYSYKDIQLVRLFFR